MMEDSCVLKNGTVNPYTDLSNVRRKNEMKCDSCDWKRPGRRVKLSQWTFVCGEATSFHCNECKKLIEKEPDDESGGWWRKDK